MSKKIILFVIVAMTCTLAAQNQITGRVTDDVDNNPIEGVHVIVKPGNEIIMTDARGLFRIDGIEAGSYTLTFSHVAYENAVREFSIPKSETNFKKDFQVKMSMKSYMQDEVIIAATRADSKTPLTTSTMSREDLQENKIAPALPYQIEMEPSVVVNSENGMVGATSMRIRGVDATRINVNINGITLNDAESQAVFWYNIPNLGGMAQSVQLQRGVGASTSGSAAFGGAINLQTLKPSANPYAEADLAAGSFKTYQYGVTAGTGLINNKLSFDVAYNGLTSDGFVRGGQTNQQSLFASAGWYGERSLLKAVVIAGEQHSGITWEGATADDLDADPRYNGRGAYYDELGNLYYYDNETDNYKQQHYQLYYSFTPTRNWTLNAAIDYTHGFGYTESYKDDKNPKKYNLQSIMSDTIISDFILNKDMLNDAYTTNLLARYANESLTLDFGGSFQLYDGQHYGEVIWAEKNNTITRDNPFSDWYSNTGLKKDAVAFAKVNYNFSDKLNLYADMQLRHVSYNLHGTDDDYGQLDYDTTHLFFNPKIGINYRLNNENSIYAVAGISNREPARADIKEALYDGSTMHHETMLDIELGYHMQKQNFNFNVNLYSMLYKNQLTANGFVTESGYSLMENVDKSYRAGVELVGGYRFDKHFSIDANATISTNKIIDYKYTATLSDWVTKTVLDLGNTDLALSPSLVGAAIFTYKPVEECKIQLIGKYVGEQYADNTSREDMKCDDYFLLNARASYTFDYSNGKNIELQFAVNNILNLDYRTNAYVYGTYDPATNTYDNYRYYFQQPGINYMFRAIARF